MPIPNLPAPVIDQTRRTLWITLISRSSKPLLAPQNPPKPPIATKNNEKTSIDLYLCQLQVNHCWFQVEFVNLSLKPAMVALESTQVQTDPRFSVICSSFWWFLAVWVKG